MLGSRVKWMVFSWSSCWHISTRINLDHLQTGSMTGSTFNHPKPLEKFTHSDPSSASNSLSPTYAPSSFLWWNLHCWVNAHSCWKKSYCIFQLFLCDISNFSCFSSCFSSCLVWNLHFFQPVTQEHRQQQGARHISQSRRAAFQRQDQAYHVAVRQCHVLEELLPRRKARWWTGCFGHLGCLISLI